MPTGSKLPKISETLNFQIPFATPDDATDLCKLYINSGIFEFATACPKIKILPMCKNEIVFLCQSSTIYSTTRTMTVKIKIMISPQNHDNIVPVTFQFLFFRNVTFITTRQVIGTSLAVINVNLMNVLGNRARSSSKWLIWREFILGVNSFP